VAGTPTGRRDGLAEQATDYVLDQGIAGLSLRPLAAALDTSDRMLVYHFGTKDTLVAEVIERSSGRSTAVLDSLPAARNPRSAVLDLWRAYNSPVIDRCLRVYAQAAALGLLGDEPYLGAARRANRAWTRAVTAYLTRTGVPPRRAERIGELVDATLFGLWIDRPADEAAVTDRVVRDLADTAQRLSGP
jgi:AcrR family transcriptional regulator